MSMSLCTVSRAVHLFKEGETDNERLAALLIIANILKSNDTDQSTRRKIFDGVGFEFINRLTYTEYSQTTQDPEPFHQVAVAILSSYCLDKELVLHPQVTSKVPQLNKFITSSISSHGLISDSLHCLHSLATVAKGRTHLWQYGSLVSLVQCVIHNQSVYDISRSVIINLLSDINQIGAKAKMITESIGIICEQIKLIHTEFKFTLCQLLIDILNICGEYILVSNEERRECKWLSDVSIGLRDILQSKLDNTHRSIGLVLVSCLSQLYGTEWTLTTSPKGKEKNSSFLLLLVNLVCVEVSMLSVDQSSLDPLLLISCFSFIENVISLMAETEDKRESEDEGEREQRDDILLTEEDLLQLHSTLLEGLTNIVHFLKSLDYDTPLFIPAVRVLGAWLAEDSLSLSSEMTLLLPSLLKLCKTEAGKKEQYSKKEGDFKEEEERMKEDIIKFLLPGIGHLIEEERLLVILLDNGLIHVLLTYTHSLMKRLADVPVQSKLEMCLTVLLNVYLKSEGERRVTSEWSSWIETLSEILLNKYVQSHCSLLILTGLLYLSVMRYITTKGFHLKLSFDTIDVIMTSLVTWVTHFMSRGNSPAINTNEILLILKELTILVQSNPKVKHHLKLSSLYPSLRQEFHQSTSSPSFDEVDVITKIDKLFISIEEEHERKEESY